MESSFVESLSLALLGGLCLVLGHRLMQLQSEVRDLRFAFDGTISLLRNPRTNGDTCAILEVELARHKDAIEKFARHLWQPRRKRFLQQWEIYYCKDGVPCLEQYSSRCEAELAQQRRVLAIHRIEDILAFGRSYTMLLPW